MANIKKTENNLGDFFYKVEGSLTEEDIKEINAFTSQVIIIIDNTVGQKSEIINMIDNDYVLFSVRGGINPDEKSKYKGRDYFDRTLMSPKALSKVIEYFENIERMIKPEWTETQKAMFLYGALARDNSYDYKDYGSDIHNAGTTLRSLNGLLYKRQVCAGFALSFKEGMDRLGIPCLFRNRMHEHDYNLIEVDGKIIGVDLTWDLTSNLCDYRWFGSEDFISNEKWGKYHTPKEEPLSYFFPDSFDFFDVQFDKSIVQDPSERIFDLDSISKSEIQSNIDVIRNSLLNYNNEAMTNIDINDTSYYPLYGDYIQQIKFERYVSPLKKELTSELDYYELAKILQQIDSHKEAAENYLNILGGRYGFILDVLAGDYDFYGKTGTDYGISELSELEINQWSLFEDYRFRNLPQEEKDRIYDLLGTTLNQYLNDVLLNLYSNCDKFIERYETLKDEFNYYKMDIIGKLQVLLHAKEYLLSLGVNERELEEKLDMINTFFKRFEKTDEEKYQDMIKAKKSAMEFYSLSLSDGTLMRKNCEIVNGGSFTDDEWFEKSHDISFMRSVLEQLKIGENRLYNDDLSDNELAYFLDVMNKLWEGKITDEEAYQNLIKYVNSEYETRVQHNETEQLMEEADEYAENNPEKGGIKI